MDAALAAIAQHVADALRSGAIRDREGLQRAKATKARLLHAAAPTDADLAQALPAALRERHADLLRTKPTRSMSGVAVIAVMSSPAACPHGKCTFCPGGPDVGVPQSYTGHEPSTMRAIRASYDPVRIVRGRLAQLQRNGHAIDKVEVVIQGGTFPAREVAYQDWLVAGIYAALNAGPSDEDAPWQDETAWALMDDGQRSARLAALMRDNESAAHRCIGLTIETKPDWCFGPHVDRMLRQGATRVEIGLQTLDEATLAATHRGHTMEDSRRAMQVARDAGLKICVHMMPGLPRQRPGTTPGGQGSLDPDPKMDIEDMRRLFAEPEWRPDMLKIYPCLVVQEGETLLKRQWQRGEYHPYDTQQAAVVIAEAKALVPETCRIQRVDRDIPSTHVEAGVLNTNLRQIVQERMRAAGTRCRCIRCREAGRRAEEGHVVDANRVQLVRREEEASRGTEVFLSMEDSTADAVVGFLRLRRVSPDAHRPESRGVPGGAAIVRELKVYGAALRLHDDPDEGSWQHRGHGTRLLAEAERVAFEEWRCGRLLVIAGPGVKEYYRDRGYSDLGAYVAKHPTIRADVQTS